MVHDLASYRDPSVLLWFLFPVTVSNLVNSPRVGAETQSFLLHPLGLGDQACQINSLCQMVATISNQTTDI
jgi:hypothetical protein